MKAHRFKGKHTSRLEVTLKFESELRQNIDNAIRQEVGQDANILEFFEYKEQHIQRIYADQKLKLLDEWKKKGRSTAFNKEPFQMLLHQKYFSKTSTPQP